MNKLTSSSVSTLHKLFSLLRTRCTWTAERLVPIGIYATRHIGHLRLPLFSSAQVSMQSEQKVCPFVHLTITRSFFASATGNGSMQTAQSVSALKFCWTSDLL